MTNVPVAGKIVDGLWPDLRLVLEFDGWKDHGKRGQFETDRLRDQHLTIANHRVIRITKRQIDSRPYALVARLASIITALRLNQAQQPPPDPT
jgi:very-short-patch-repair endonuclease